jgi:hypothetical protein
VDHSLNILHHLTFARGSEALEFVRTLRDLTQAQVRGGLAEIGPILVYGARIVAPDAPAELYVSVGALTLAHALGVASLTNWPAKDPAESELPADMALLFTATDLPDETALR